MSTTPTTPFNRAARRRATIYIAVLAVSMFVAVIGLSALTLTRIQNRTVTGTEDAVKARFYAQSVVELALFYVNADADWRNNYVTDVWTPNTPMGPATLSFKLVDEQDGDLADSPTDPVRLHGAAAVDNAVRIFSLLLEAQSPVNQLTNADMENGTTDWFVPGAAADLESLTDNPYGGVAYLWVKNRTSADAGPRQDVTTRITNGATHYAEVWIAAVSMGQNVEVLLSLDTSNGSQEFSFVTSTVGPMWTKLSGTATPAWTGTLYYAHWRIKTSVQTFDFKIDDAILIEGDGPPTIRMEPVPGSWRQEILP